ncbi:hypothetical protein GQ43DRAFT_484463 [Delitschia confertaspora ATCC 74209]|uniref:SURP motif domain-containing protein n=1 Tax=Delitschia confertaspora ATCC 74209 TaxID=1513339 RepID=A0A9P4MNE8_9PLEO|nr:hypothetical protein GQ43DRAFT_484463 [Delitschia confertaspora ATCC 74209]
MAASTPNGEDALSTNGMAHPPAGMILPPTALRQKLEKTAAAVALKGRGLQFEARMLLPKPDEEKRRLGILFVNEDDPYNAYYRWFRDECLNGRGPTGEGQQGTPANQMQKEKGPPPPPEFRFSARMPTISAKDLEVIKLTALWTAKNGEGWKRTLSQKEAGNYQFDFLRPQHSLHQFFTRLIDQYKILLDEDHTKQARLAELRHNVEDRFHILERAKQRAQQIKNEEEQRLKKEKAEEDERKEYASIDWHDFKLVATVTFDEADDQAELPAPTSLNDLQSASLEQKALMSLQPHDRRIEEAMPYDETYFNVSQPSPHIPPPPVQPSPYLPQAQPAIPEDYRTPAQKVHDEEEELRIKERQLERERAQQAMAAAKGTGPMRIREDYVPRAAAKKSNAPTAICPICKQSIRTDELDNHIRIESLDPRWKEQKAKAESRYGTTNLSTADVANNLKRLASQRDDVFDGVTGLPISEEELARRKRAATSYDGQPDPAKDAIRLQQMQTMNVEDQLRQLKQKFAG